MILSIILNNDNGARGLAARGRLDRPAVRASCASSYKMFTLLDLCGSSLRWGHANLLCIVPMSTDDPRREPKAIWSTRRTHRAHSRCAGGHVGCAGVGDCTVAPWYTTHAM